ncbi:cell fate (sporulation/competence/biofilm development) regulator YlbF (YheA/YmcA/DUF963 family) [Scopulibacillus daqui]|uniref:UPF0342 protein JOD45_003148 n=1 Tax=Scopulibacillus daqui TaxID=1469162 RepID=A0ABS2Q3V2_9BACL|nr:YlbF family regulator [Scopulibacillus daqui]MBM7646913.1 cell fate (sporulation/competence/biofilm development) regulator YlbF (YheA/YmcA/DUF963 family) [Scopulibacillus daqui]
MANLHDIAYDMEQAIRNSDEYQTLTKAYKEVNEDDIAKKMFDNFRQLQLTLQKKQMTGQQITEEEAQKAQQQVQLIQQHEVISNLMAAEQKMSMLISDLNKIITKPLEDIYGKSGDAS